MGTRRRQLDMGVWLKIGNLGLILLLLLFLLLSCSCLVETCRQVKTTSPSTQCGYYVYRRTPSSTSLPPTLTVPTAMNHTLPTLGPGTQWVITLFRISSGGSRECEVGRSGERETSLTG